MVVLTPPDWCSKYILNHLYHPKTPKKLLAHILWKFLSYFLRTFSASLFFVKQTSNNFPFWLKTKTSVMQKYTSKSSIFLTRQKKKKNIAIREFRNIEAQKSTQKVHIFDYFNAFRIFFHQKRTTFHFSQSAAVYSKSYLYRVYLCSADTWMKQELE